ncbi:unnamed protein product [Closterium sp. NIES-65]|nr:unnamed protein product [Closterium sp. NIES-65]
MSPSRLSPSRLSPSRLSPSRLSPSRLSPSRLSPARLSPAPLTLNPPPPLPADSSNFPPSPHPLCPLSPRAENCVRGRQLEPVVFPKIVYVGGSSNRLVSPWGFAMKDWKAPKVLPGDSLVLQWSGEVHSVHKVSAAEYAACTFVKAKQLARNRNYGSYWYKVNWREYGKTIYFSSKANKDCSLGIKRSCFPLFSPATFSSSPPSLLPRRPTPPPSAISDVRPVPAAADVRLSGDDDQRSPPFAARSFSGSAEAQKVVYVGGNNGRWLSPWGFAVKDWKAPKVLPGDLLGTSVSELGAAAAAAAGTTAQVQQLTMVVFEWAGSGNAVRKEF